MEIIGVLALAVLGIYILFLLVKRQNENEYERKSKIEHYYKYSEKYRNKMTLHLNI